MNRASHSFFAAFVGWLVPFLGWMLWQQFNENGFGYITDFEFFLFWPLLFTMLGWLIIGLPIALSTETAELPRLPKVLFVSTGATVGTFVCLAALIQFGLMILVWWPLLTGLIGGCAYWFLQKTQPLRGWVFWASPLLFLPSVRFVLLPIGIAFFPYTTHVLTEGAIGPEALLGVIRQVKVGDSYSDLHRRYPAIFERPVLSTGGRGNYWHYSIKFDEAREKVVSVKIEMNTEGE